MHSDRRSFLNFTPLSLCIPITAVNLRAFGIKYVTFNDPGCPVAT